MRILTVTNMYPTAANPQFGIFVKEQVDSIRALGHEVDVVFANAKEGKFRHKGYLLGFPQMWRALAKKRYDVVHAHYHYSGLIARAQWQAPLVLTHHGPELHDSFEGPLCRATRWMPDEIIVVAPWMVPILGASRVNVIPCGVNPDLFRPIPRDEARQALGLPLDRRYVLFAGNYLNPRKRLHLAEAAVNLLRRRHPDIELLKVAKEPHERIPLYMSAADVFAMTSTYEGSAQVVKEAMFCNLPIIATDAGDNWSVIDGVPGCFKVTPEPETIAASLEQALSPPQRTNGRDYVGRFSLQTVAREVVDIYEQARKTASPRYVSSQAV